MRDKIKKIILDCIQEAANVQGLRIEQIGNTTDLIGNQGIFDSMASITLITFLEDRMKNEFSLSVSLINEMENQADNNPLQNVNSLTDLLENRIKGATSNS